MVYRRRAKKSRDWVPPTGAGRVVKKMAPRLDGILIKSYAQLLAMVEDLWELEDELQKKAEAERQLWAEQGRGSKEDLEEAEDFVKKQEEFKVLTTGDMDGAKEWLQQQGCMRFRHLC